MTCLEASLEEILVIHVCRLSSAIYKLLRLSKHNVGMEYDRKVTLYDTL